MQGANGDSRTHVSHGRAWARARGLVLAREMERRGRSWWIRLVVAGLCVVNPVTFKALWWGHPEEVLGAALCVGAVLAAGRGRTGTGGLLLGLAIATKQWALL